MNELKALLQTYVVKTFSSLPKNASTYPLIDARYKKQHIWNLKSNVGSKKSFHCQSQRAHILVPSDFYVQVVGDGFQKESLISLVPKVPSKSSTTLELS